MEEENVIICPSCGAKLLATEAQCPYCGQTNAKGAEYQYMGRLYHMVDDMEDMEDDAVCATLESGKSGAKFIGIVVGLSVMLAIVIMTINIVMARVDDRESQKEWEWRITWVPIVIIAMSMENLSMCGNRRWRLLTSWSPLKRALLMGISTESFFGRRSSSTI